MRKIALIGAGNIGSTMAHIALPKAAAGVVAMTALTLIASQVLNGESEVPGALSNSVLSSPFVQDAPAPKINLPAVNQQQAERRADK